MIKFFVSSAVLLAAFLAVPSAAQAREETLVVVCESHQQARNYCEVAMKVYDVEVNRQLSNADCIEGRTWAHDNRGIWVAGGCRAEFLVTARHDRGYGYDDNRRDRGYDRDDDHGYGGGRDRGSDRPDEIVTCESTGYDQEWCEINGVVNVRLINQLSNSPCNEGRTWGFGRRGIWVSQGCRAEFKVIR